MTLRREPICSDCVADTTARTAPTVVDSRVATRKFVSTATTTIRSVLPGVPSLHFGFLEEHSAELRLDEGDRDAPEFETVRDKNAREHHGRQRREERIGIAQGVPHHEEQKDDRRHEQDEPIRARKEYRRLGGPQLSERVGE